MMRKLGYGLFVLAIACGGGKPAEDASNANDTSGSGDSSGSSDNSSSSSGSSSSGSSSSSSGSSSSGSSGSSSGSSGSSGSSTPAAPKTPYDKESVDVVLARGGRQVKDHCGGTKDADNKLTGPWGKTTVTVQLGHNGHSKGATLKPPFDGTPVGRCINNAFTNLIYPPFAGDDTTVDYDVEVVKPGDAK